ncbi:hypothetical protein CLV40_118114 [Actinokineospora auranticolor]|uniref:Uncharacterized protein n=1 Tax=Actinokineospora auranticolor TaxID=155976 RepID=A0A2S6GHL7_9PSEU|nr:hypothetical protein CLV40_118114 [Actinokineospora auranticolor]
MLLGNPIAALPTAAGPAPSQPNIHNRRFRRGSPNLPLPCQPQRSVPHALKPPPTTPAHPVRRTAAHPRATHQSRTPPRPRHRITLRRTHYFRRTRPLRRAPPTRHVSSVRGRPGLPGAIRRSSFTPRISACLVFTGPGRTVSTFGAPATSGAPCPRRCTPAEGCASRRLMADRDCLARFADRLSRRGSPPALYSSALGAPRHTLAHPPLRARPALVDAPAEGCASRRLMADRECLARFAGRFSRRRSPPALLPLALGAPRQPSGTPATSGAPVLLDTPRRPVTLVGPWHSRNAQRDSPVAIPQPPLACLVSISLRCTAPPLDALRPSSARLTDPRATPVVLGALVSPGRVPPQCASHPHPVHPHRPAVPIPTKE